jgi:hypothetical protein
VLNKTLFDKFVYSKIFAFLIFFSLASLLLLDVLFSYFGNVLSTTDYIFITVQLVGVSLVFTIPTDLFIMSKRKAKTK